MDNHSRRFQNVRLSSPSSTNFLPGALKPPLFGEDNSPGGTPLLLLKNNENKQKNYSLDRRSRQLQSQKSSFLLRLWYSLPGLFNLFYAPLLTCFRIITNCLHRIICQSGGGGHRQLEPENRDDDNCCSSSQPDQDPLNGYHHHDNNINRNEDNYSSYLPPASSSSAALYSSDSEEDDDSYYGAVGTTQYRVAGESFVKPLVIDDNDIPGVCLIDNVIYFVHLYRTNYPAFVKELSQSLCHWGFPEPLGDYHQRRVSNRHNLNVKEKRPKFVKKGLEYLKRRRLAKMSRTFGDDAHKQWVLRIAVASRLLIFFLQFLMVNLPRAFKHENDGFKFAPEETYGKLLDPLVNSTFGGYINWDAHYFLHISVYGYTSENILAFFPLLPMLLYFPTRILYFVMGSFISLSSIVTVVGALFNTWLFVKCADNVYEVARFRAGGASRQLITTACIMFCFNPASIFFSGLYTETLFAYLTSSVMISLLRGETGTSLICAALSCLCRSNGILNVGFILALDLQTQLRDINAFRFVNFAIIAVAKLVFAVAPFILYQVYAVILFCNKGKIYDDPSEVPLYCVEDWSGTFGIQSLPYSYIQKKYWNVGFLEYYEFKQIPNFLLAAPVLYLTGSESWTAFKLSVAYIASNNSYTEGIYPLFHALHGLFLTAFCLFFVHVQVSTRMIMAACPYLFVYLAASQVEEVEKFRNRQMNLPVQSLAITVWCIVYFLVGTIMFSLGLPWT